MKETKISSSNLDQVKASMQSYSYEPTSGSTDITTVGGIVCIYVVCWYSTNNH